MIRLAFCVEDDSDERIFVALLKRLSSVHVEADPDARVARRRGGGRAAALALAPKVATTAWQRGLDGAVFAIDNDGAPEHEDGHDGVALQCSWCQLVAALRPVAWTTTAPRPPKTPAIWIVAVPVQTLESWLLLARGTALLPTPSERGRTGGDRRELKRLLYGVVDADRERRLSVALPLAEALDSSELSRRSPSFRTFADQVRRLIPSP